MDEQKIQESALTVYEQAQGMKVTDTQTQDLAAVMLKGVDELIKEISDTFDPLIKAAHETHKKIIEKKKKYADLPEKAKNLLRKAIGDYQQAERARAQEEARKRQEEERAKAEAARLKEAEKLEQEGKTEEAAKALDEPIVIAKFQERQIEKPSGIAYRENWKFKIVDPAKIPAEYLMPDMVKIGQYVRAMKERGVIPGIEIYAEGSSHVR